jgi:malate permease and related proteins
VGVVTAVLQLVPVFAGVAAGHLLVRTGVATREHGRFLFVCAFYVCVPALVFDAFADVELTWQLATLPLAALLAVVGGYVAGSLVSRAMPLPRPRLAVFLMACMIVNTGFTLPFIQASLGNAGVARLMAFDAVNSALVFTWVYAIAVRSNPEQHSGSVVWRKVLTSPPLYGLVAGLAANAAGLRPSETLQRLLEAFGAPTSFLVTIGIGMLLVIERSEMRVSAWAIATRLCTSLLIGLALIAAFDLTGLERAVLLTLCVAPVGFNTVTFASLENLDLRLATGTTSLSLAASLVLVPVVLLAAA